VQQFQVALSQLDGAAAGDLDGTVSITDDDGPPSVAIGNVTRVESDSVAAFTVSVSTVCASGPHFSRSPSRAWTVTTTFARPRTRGIGARSAGPTPW
jgi:hypothetical protein